MKKYGVTIPIAGEVYVEVMVPDNATEDDIFDKACDSHQDMNSSANIEWEFFQHLIEGGCLHVPNPDWDYREIKMTIPERYAWMVCGAPAKWMDYTGYISSAPTHDTPDDGPPVWRVSLDRMDSKYRQNWHSVTLNGARADMVFPHKEQ